MTDTSEEVKPKNAVIVFIFPEPEEDMKMAYLIDKSRSLFKDLPEVRAMLAVNTMADAIIDICTPPVEDAEQEKE